MSSGGGVSPVPSSAWISSTLDTTGLSFPTKVDLGVSGVGFAEMKSVCNVGETVSQLCSETETKPSVRYWYVISNG